MCRRLAQRAAALGGLYTVLTMFIAWILNLSFRIKLAVLEQQPGSGECEWRFSIEREATRMVLLQFALPVFIWLVVSLLFLGALLRVVKPVVLVTLLCIALALLGALALPASFTAGPTGDLLPYTDYLTVARRVLYSVHPFYITAGLMGLCLSYTIAAMRRLAAIN